MGISAFFRIDFRKIKWKGSKVERLKNFNRFKVQKLKKSNEVSPWSRQKLVFLIHDLKNTVVRGRCVNGVLMWKCISLRASLCG